MKVHKGNNMNIPQLERIAVKVKFVNVTYGDIGQEIVAFFMYQHANRIYARGLIMRDAYVHDGQH